MKIVLALLILLNLTACFPTTNYTTKKLYYKQPKEEVLKIMGKPFSKKAFYTKEYYVYYIHNDIFDLIITTSKFPYFGFYPFMRTGKEFWIIFENEEIISFGNSTNYRTDLPRSMKYED